MKKDLDRFENWAKGSSMKFKENTGFCTGEGEMLDSKHSLEDEQLKRSSAEWDLGVLVDMSQQ